jgi:hypothetical protein
MSLRLFGTPLLVAAIVFASAPGAAQAQPPFEEPIFQEVDDINPCTGGDITLTFEGTRRVQLVGDHRIVHAWGTVTTSDGYTGKFNRQLVFIGDRVETRRFFDMEVGPNRERIRLTANLHITVVDGEITAEVDNARLVCIGKP